jgi:hypothetical protein
MNWSLRYFLDLDRGSDSCAVLFLFGGVCGYRDLGGRRFGLVKREWRWESAIKALGTRNVFSASVIYSWFLY